MSSSPMTHRPPTGRGSRRFIPRTLTDVQRQRLRALLEHPQSWVLRSDWERYLETGNDALVVMIDELSREHRIAVFSWLHQQRHALFHAIEGGRTAPEGWLEKTPLFEALLGSLTAPLPDAP